MINSVEPHPESNYSFSWAEGVIFNWYGSHPRAPYFIEKIWGLTSKQLVTIVAKRQDVWRFVKESFNQYDKWANSQLRLFPEYDAEDPKLAANAIRMIKKTTKHINVPETVEKYIDKRLKLLHI